MTRSHTTAKLISELNLSDECDFIEAKEISGADAGSSLYESICSFSNEPGLGGGIILLGVKRDTSQLFPVYSIAGVKDPDKISSDIISACQNTFNLSIRPHIKTEIVQRKAVLRVEIDELSTSQKPLYISRYGCRAVHFVE